MWPSAVSQGQPTCKIIHGKGMTFQSSTLLLHHVYLPPVCLMCKQMVRPHRNQNSDHSFLIKEVGRMSNLLTCKRHEEWVDGATKCPELMSIASQVQWCELNSRWCQWSENTTNVFWGVQVLVPVLTASTDSILIELITPSAWSATHVSCYISGGCK